jgi:hypothetical protein
MLPKEGKTFPAGKDPGEYASAIAQALERELGDSHRAIKVTMRWTGAGERTVKNWFAGRNGPNGQHLVELLRRSDEVLKVLLQLAGRDEILVANTLLGARDKLAEMLTLIHLLMDGIPPTPQPNKVYQK